MKAMYPDTMNRILIDAGFTIQSVKGDYSGSILTEDSELQLYDCTL